MRNLKANRWFYLALVLAGIAVAGVALSFFPRPRPILSGPVQVNDSTQILAAQLKNARNELTALKDAAKAVDGKLVAGMKIIIHPETVFVDRAVRVTDTLPGGQRVAALDTIVDGVEVHVSTLAPAYPAPLEIGARVVVPQLTPEVGFVKRDDQYYAVVSVAGRTFTPSQAFLSVPKVRRLQVVAGGQALVDASTINLIGYAGLGLRLSTHGTVTAAATTRQGVLVQYQHRIF